MFDYEVILRPEAHDLLNVCRAGGRQVFLFTNAFFGFALAASKTFSLGFDETSIDLSPGSALIDNKPGHLEPTREKMLALGIPAEQVWMIPSFEPPRFPSAKLFLLGLPIRLDRLDRAGRGRPHR